MTEIYRIKLTGKRSNNFVGYYMTKIGGNPFYPRTFSSHTIAQAVCDKLNENKRRRFNHSVEKGS